MPRACGYRRTAYSCHVPSYRRRRAVCNSMPSAHAACTIPSISMPRAHATCLMPRASHLHCSVHVVHHAGCSHHVLPCHRLSYVRSNVPCAQATCIIPSSLVRAPTCRVRSPCASMISSPLTCGPASRVLTPRAFMPSPLVRVVQHAVLTPRASYHCRSCVIQRAVMLYTSTPLLCVNQHAVCSYHV